MKKNYLLFIIVLLGSKLNAQNNFFQWSKSIGDLSYDYAVATSVDSLGNVYIAGTFQGTVDFDAGSGIYNLTSLGAEDIYILKLDMNGNFLWAKGFGSTLGDQINAMTLDRFGNVYATGAFQATVDFDPGAGTYTLASSGSVDAFVLKLDFSGNFLWAGKIGGTTYQGGNRITLDRWDNVLIAGNFDGTADFDPSIATYTLTAPLSLDNFILKLNSSGQFVWAKRIGGDSQNMNLGIAVDKTGSVYTCGYFYYHTDFDPGSGTYSLTATGSDKDIFVSKLDVSGNFVWAKRIGSANEDLAQAMTIDTTGNLYITGTFVGTVDFDPNAGTFNLTSVGGVSGLDMYVLKLNSSGNFIWTKSMGGANTELCTSIAIDSIGNIYTTGSFRNTADFNPNAGVNNLTSNCVNCEDMFISKLDSTGTYVWAINIGTSSYSTGGSHIKSDKNGSIYICGSFRGTTDFDPGAGVSNLTSLGTNLNADGYILKLGPCLNVPSAPVNSTTPLNQIICANNSTTLTATSSGTIKWYTSPTSTLVIGTGNSFVTSTLAAGAYNYYAETVSSCTVSASRTIITVTVNALPTFTLPTLSGTITCANMGAGLSVNTNTLYNVLWSGPGPINPAPTVVTVTVTGAGIYTLTVIDANMCANNGTVSVTTNTTAPVVNVIPSVPVFCGGGNTTIVANSTPTNSVSYLWDNASTTQSISVSPTITTIYTATVTDNTNGCYASNSTMVTVYPFPNLTINGISSVCMGTSTIIGVTGNAVSYFWNIGATTPTITISPTVTTTYTVTGTNQYGCISTETVSVTVDNTCANVWPGDANNDGIADNLDVLELGLHFSQTGAPRMPISDFWQPYFANNWAGTITNGKNLNHSDCNGDGVINDDDTLAIYYNYSLTHMFKPTQTATNPQLSIVPDQAMVAKGSWGTASVYLGDITSPVTNVNGIAFTIDFDNTLIEPNSIWIEYQNSFIDAGQNLRFRKLDFVNSKLFTASTHTLSNNVSGAGKIATLHYQILSSLATDQTLTIGLSQVNQSDVNGAIVPLTSGSGTLVAIGASVGVKEIGLSGNVSISPNPTNGILNINFSTIPQNIKIEMYNSIGALVFTETMPNKNNTINVNDLSTGIYYMKVLEANKVVAVKKVVKE
jgi:hypothetical protein